MLKSTLRGLTSLRNRRRTSCLFFLTLTTLLSYDTLLTFWNTSPFSPRRLCDDRYYITEAEAKSMETTDPVITTPTSSVPSHIELCREFLERKNMYDNGMTTNFNQFTVQEDEAVCMDWSMPHGRLMEIFSSSLIAHVGGPLFKISYEHNCQRTVVSADELVQEARERTIGADNADEQAEGNDNEMMGGDFDRTTIQQIYPISGLVLDDESDDLAPVNLDLMTDLCKGCTHSFGSGAENQNSQEVKPHSSHHCILYPGSFPERPDGRLIPLAAIIETIQDRLRQSAAEWKTNAGVVPFPKESESGAVIYFGETSSGMPFYHYHSHIPDSVSSIQILGSPKCAVSTMADGSKCADHGRELKEYLKGRYPNANVRFDLTASTAASYARMITSQYLVCSPGTVDCLLTALSKEVNTYAILSESSARQSTSHWFDALLPYADSNIVIHNFEGEEFEGDRASVVEQQQEQVQVASVGGTDVDTTLMTTSQVSTNNPQDEQVDTTYPDFSGAGSLGSTTTTTTASGGGGNNNVPASFSSTTTTTGASGGGSSSGNFGGSYSSVTGGGSYTPTGIGGAGGGTNPYITASNTNTNAGYGPTTLSGGTGNTGMYTSGTPTTTSWTTASPNDREGCTELRGRLGSWDPSGWDKDFDYNALSEHAEHIVGRSGSLNDMPLLMSGKQASSSGVLGWRENDPNCDLDMLNLEGLCQVVAAMDLHRLYFVGDNLMSDQVASFWKLLGANVNEPYMPDADGNWRKTVTCPNQGGAQFEIVFTRNDRLVYGDAQASQLISQGFGGGGFGSFMGGGGGGVYGGNDPCACNSWMNDYLSNPGRTFVIAGAGAMGSPGYGGFQNDFNAFMAGVQAAQRPNDFVALRTTPTQAYGCCACSASYNLAGGPGFHRGRGLQKFDVSPKEITKMNNYVISTIHDHNLSRRAEEHKRRVSSMPRRTTYHDSMPTMRLLHVAPMMEVHPHFGAKGQRQLNCDGAGASHDPHDAWNHQLFSMMLDMMQQQMKQQQQQIPEQGVMVPP